MLEEKPDYYSILGIQQNSNQDEIKKAYKKLAMLYHPDKNIEKQEKYVEYFRLISEAYEVLSDQEKKRGYDALYISQRFLSQMRGKYNLHQSVNHPQKMQQDQSSTSEYDTRSCFVNGKRIFRKSQGIPLRTFKSTKDKEFQNPCKNKSNNQDLYNDFLNDMGDDGVSKSTCKYTKNVNGVSATIVRTTITKKDGSKEIRQQTIEEMGSTTKLYSLGVGQTYRNKALN